MVYLFRAFIYFSVIWSLQGFASNLDRRCRPNLANTLDHLSFVVKLPTLESFFHEGNSQTETRQHLIQTYNLIAKHIQGPDKGIYFKFLKDEGSYFVEKLVWSQVDLANRDPNFGEAFNRVGLYKKFLELAAKRTNEKISVVYFDLAYFKIVNEILGQDEADDILSFFIAELNKFKRADDFVGRWGGDEILFVLDTSKENAELKVLARLMSYRSQIAERYKNRILSKIQDSKEYREIIEKAINTSTVDPALLAELGIPTRLNGESVMDFQQKIENEIVVLGSARYGVAEIDFSKIDFARTQTIDVLSHFDSARNEAEKQAVQRKLQESKALGTSSRPSGLK